MANRRAVMPKVVFMYPDVAFPTIAEIDARRAPRERLTGFYQLRERHWNVSISDARWRGALAWVRRRADRLVHLPSAGMLRDWWRADIVVVKDDFSLILTLLARLLRKRLVYLDSMFQLPRSRRRRIVAQKCVERADRIVCFSDSQAELWQQEFGVEQGVIVAVPWGMDPAFYRPRPVRVDEPPYVLSVGRDIGRNFDLLVDALAGSGVNIKLVTLPYLVSERVRRSPNVEILERLSYDALFDLYARAAVVAVPLHGPLTYPSGIRAVMEAMLLERPVLATRTPVLSEYFTDGEDLILVEQRDGSDMRDAVLRLVRDPDRAHQLGTAGRQRVARDYTVSHYADQLEAVLYDVANARSGKVAETQLE
jgi:glycosyltransferase involved in cell wall biosynthesis